MGSYGGKCAMLLKCREKRKDSIMRHLNTILSGAAILLFMSPAAAQNAPATFRADPSVYKLLYEEPEHSRDFRDMGQGRARQAALTPDPIGCPCSRRLYPPALRARRYDERHHQQGWLYHGGANYVVAHC